MRYDVKTYNLLNDIGKWLTVLNEETEVHIMVISVNSYDKQFYKRIEKYLLYVFNNGTSENIIRESN